ncbi:FAD-binding oxidoreductase [bacterium]|nr:MAG: FAD-binding oxidoreductase [bacterium]
MKSLLQELIRHELVDVVGEEHVIVDASAREDFATDYSWAAKYLRLRDLPMPAPNVVVRPSSHDEVVKIVRIASTHRLPIVAKGGGSGTQGGVLALYGGIGLDLRRMNRILEIDEVSLCVTAEAGIAGTALEEAVSARGLTLAHYPGSMLLDPTLGGFLAARGSGVVSTKYGKAEDIVMALRAAVPPGKTFRTHPVPNHATGPSLLGAFVGSEGTLGVITEATMRLDPLPEARRFLGFAFDDVFAGLRAGRDVMAARWRPAAMRLYDDAGTRDLASVLGLDVQGSLMVIMCDGDARLADLEAEAIAAICTRRGARELGETAGRTWWDGRYKVYKAGVAPEPPLLFGTTDTVCRFKDIEALYRAKKETIERGFARYAARYTAHFSHWYPWGTMVYDRFYVDQPPQEPREAIALHESIWDAAVRVNLRYGGTVNEHHGIGVKLGRFVREQYGEEAFSVVQDVKDAIDPAGIMNPGKLGFGPPR